MPFTDSCRSFLPFLPTCVGPRVVSSPKIEKYVSLCRRECDFGMDTSQTSMVRLPTSPHLSPPLPTSPHISPRISPPLPIPPQISANQCSSAKVLCSRGSSRPNASSAYRKASRKGLGKVVCPSSRPDASAGPAAARAEATSPPAAKCSHHSLARRAVRRRGGGGPSHPPTPPCLRDERRHRPRGGEREGLCRAFQAHVVLVQCLPVPCVNAGDTGTVSTAEGGRAQRKACPLEGCGWSTRLRLSASSPPCESAAFPRPFLDLS